MTSPIRVGLIGLGQTKTEVGPGAWGSTVHLPYILASPKYELVAVQNSSVQSAQRAIDFHKLGPKVKAYGSPEDLARDQNVDLIVVTVKVATHFALTKPALLAGKDVFVEWPLGVTAAEAEELTKLAEAKGVKTMVGQQARASPVVVKIKELVSSGQIGKVTSSTVTGTFAPLPYDIFFEGAEYYLDINSGGNPLTISFGHFLDSFIDVLGDFRSVKSVLKTDYPTTHIINSSGKVVHPNHPKTSPDHISVQGILSSGAAASLVYRTTVGPSIDGVGIRWLITGTDGEIEIVTTESQWQIAPPDGVVVRARIGKGAEVKIVDYSLDGEDVAVKESKNDAMNTARLYEAFAVQDTGRFSTFQAATETHKLLERIRSAAS